VLRQVGDALAARGAAIMDGMVSPLRGADGNVEFLVHARAPTPDRPAGAPAVDLGALADGAAPV
jgi:hypothetical protein